jgi:hypothetical protein
MEGYGGFQPPRLMVQTPEEGLIVGGMDLHGSSGMEGVFPPSTVRSAKETHMAAGSSNLTAKSLALPKHGRYLKITTSLSEGLAFRVVCTTGGCGAEKESAVWRRTC